MSFSEPLLTRLRFSHRFHSACRLLRNIWSFDYNIPIDMLWGKYAESPWKVLELDTEHTSCDEFVEDLRSVCRICGIPINNENLVIVLLCVKYQFAIRYILKSEQLKAQKNDVTADLERRAVTYGLLVKYLWNRMNTMNDDGSQAELPAFKGMLDEIHLWLVEKGCQDYKRPENFRDPDYMDYVYETPEIFQYVFNLFNAENASEQLRDRSWMRGFIWWRWKNQGMKHNAIMDRWNAKYPNEYVNNETLVTKAIGKYEREHGSKMKVMLDSHLGKMESIFQADEIWYAFRLTHGDPEKLSRFCSSRKRPSIHKYLAEQNITIV